MVALYNFEDQYGQNPRTLGDWVKNFRLKKVQMKRKLRTSSGGELRVCAILSTALMTAELELRRKQQERFQKWLDFQAKIKNNELTTRSDQQSHHNNPHSHNSEDNRCKQSEEIDKLWKCELSDLDNFMRSISSSSNSRNNSNDSSIGGGGCSQQQQGFCQPLTSQQSIQVTS